MRNKGEWLSFDAWIQWVIMKLLRSILFSGMSIFDFEHNLCIHF